MPVVMDADRMGVTAEEFARLAYLRAKIFRRDALAVSVLFIECCDADGLTTNKPGSLPALSDRLHQSVTFFRPDQPPARRWPPRQTCHLAWTLPASVRR